MAHGDREPTYGLCSGEKSQLSGVRIMTMPLRVLVVGLVVWSFSPRGQAQGTAFTYQGRLSSGANPATGIYDFQFELYDAASAGGPVGLAVTNTAVGVTNGLFSVPLDFGGV